MTSSLSPASADRIRAFFAPEAAARWELVEGDSLGLLTHVPDATIDAFLNDGPYSSGGMFRGDRVAKTGSKYLKKRLGRPDFEGDTRDQLSFKHWASLWVGEGYRACRRGAVAALFTDWRQLSPTIAALQAGGFVFRGVAAWNKTEGVRPQKGRFRNQLEFVVWGSKGPLPPDRIGGEILPGFVECAAKPSNKGGHQVGKPEEVARWLVRSCEEGGVVLDGFAGHASIGKACLALGRRYLGFEIVPRIATAARAELEAHAQLPPPKCDKQLSLFEGGARPSVSRALPEASAEACAGAAA